MLSKERYQQHRSLFQASKLRDMLKQSTPGTLSPETTTTTSSGYSTGGSSVSTSINPFLKKFSSSSAATSTVRKEHHHQQQKQQTRKSKGLPNLLTKLKNLLLPSKTKSVHLKSMRSTTSREISSTNRLRQYRQQSPIYDVLPSSSSLIMNNAVSLPFTYYYNSPIRQSRANFEKISAWLNHTDKLNKNKHDSNEFLFIDINQHPSTSSSFHEIDNQGITVVMKKTPMNIKPPKRSSSLVTRITRPIIEKQSQKTLSPSASFSSSILTRGMSERMTPPPLSSSSHKTENHLSKLNRRRTTDFSRRRTIDGTQEQKSNKENISIKNHEKSSEDIYQFPNHKVGILLPSSKHIATKKYYFHSNPTKPNEDLLNNSYGLTLLNQQPRHSTATTVLMMSQVPSQIPSQKQPYTPRTSRKQQQQQQHHTSDSLDDLLCDREVESYFYPTSSQSEHIYMNVENPFSSSSSSIHGTLC